MLDRQLRFALPAVRWWPSMLALCLAVALGAAETAADGPEPDPEPDPEQGTAAQNTAASQGVTFDYQGVLETAASPATALDAIWRYEYLPVFTPADELRLLESAEDKMLVRYDISFLFYKSWISLWRARDRQAGTLTFALHSYWVNSGLLPGLVGASGSFTITPRGDGARVVYDRTSIFDREIGSFYRWLLESKTDGFIEDLAEHIGEVHEATRSAGGANGVP